jgi:Trypsin
MMGRSSLFALALVACAGPTQVSFVSNERPSSAGAPQGLAAGGAAHHEHPNGSHQLPNDEEVIEPDHPAVDTKEERALVHIHGPEGTVCSGVMLGPRLVATAQQCLKGEAKGASVIAGAREYRVEIASSTLTWTVRRPKYALLPSCEAEDLDVGILVLSEPAGWVEPLKVVSAPTTGSNVRALGFGRCAGDKALMKVARVAGVRSRAAEAVVIDAPLCRGDVGGPVVDGREGGIVGLISHRDDPEGSPLRTTTITRLDTVQARELLSQAELVAAGTDVAKVKAVVCH